MDSVEVCNIRRIGILFKKHGKNLYGFKTMDSHFRGNDSNSRSPNMSFLCKQESRKRKSIVTMKYKEDTRIV